MQIQILNYLHVWSTLICHDLKSQRYIYSWMNRKSRMLKFHTICSIWALYWVAAFIGERSIQYGDWAGLFTVITTDILHSTSGIHISARNPISWKNRISYWKWSDMPVPQNVVSLFSHLKTRLNTKGIISVSPNSSDNGLSWRVGVQFISLKCHANIYYDCTWLNLWSCLFLQQYNMIITMKETRISEK